MMAISYIKRGGGKGLKGMGSRGPPCGEEEEKWVESKGEKGKKSWSCSVYFYPKSFLGIKFTLNKLNKLFG